MVTDKLTVYVYALFEAYHRFFRRKCGIFYVIFVGYVIYLNYRTSVGGQGPLGGIPVIYTYKYTDQVFQVLTTGVTDNCICSSTAQYA